MPRTGTNLLFLFSERFNSTIKDFNLFVNDTVLNPNYIEIPLPRKNK